MIQSAKSDLGDLAAGVRAGVNFHHLLGIDFGVGLGGGQRSVTLEFLHRAQIAAVGQQMGGEGMAQRVRRGAFAEP